MEIYLCTDGGGVPSVSASLYWKPSAYGVRNTGKLRGPRFSIAGIIYQ